MPLLPPRLLLRRSNQAGVATLTPSAVPALLLFYLLPLRLLLLLPLPLRLLLLLPLPLQLPLPLLQPPPLRPRSKLLQVRPGAV
jgi:hypothetical protein